MSNELTLKQVYGTTALIPVDRIIALLNQETDLEKIADFTVKVEAAKMIDKENDTRRNYWGELAIWSTRRLGELIQLGQDEGQLAKRGGDKKSKSHDVTLILADLGIEKMQSARAQKLAGLPAEKIQAYIARQHEIGDEISKAGVLRYSGSDGTICTKHNNDIVDWYTPEKYIDAVRKAMGGIDLDPASSDAAQKTVKAAVHYTAADDGLSKDWSGRVYLNPPYKMPLVRDFVFMLCDAVESKAVSQAVLLTNDNTDTSWWHRAASVATVVCFHYGRISFYNATGDWSSPTNGQTFFYFGGRPAAFRKAFNGIGLCLVR